MSDKKKTRREFLRAAGVVSAAALAGKGSALTPPSTTSAPASQPTSRPGSPPGAGRQPMISEALFRPTQSGCTVHWLAGEPVDVRLLAGDDPESLREVFATQATMRGEHAIEILQPNRPAYVQFATRSPDGGEWAMRPPRRIHTARKPGSEFKVAIMADTHTHATLRRRGAAQHARQTAARILADRPDFVVFVGDEASMIHRIYRRRKIGSKAANKTWAEWRTLYMELLASVPSLLVLGNHEGEAGYYQSYPGVHGKIHLQRVATIARKRFLLNPLPTTYPEGGENEGWVGDQDSDATGGADEGNASPFQNYFAWTWGDALFVVLDVHRYTNPGGNTPSTPEQWTLGEAQKAWFERVLRGSKAKWKVVLCHHLVGGWSWDGAGQTKDTDYTYGRGGGKYARVGEQAWVNDLMKETGARFFLYGHDHIFAHQPADGIEFVCCGRSSYLNPEWYERPGWYEAYGDHTKRDPHDFYAAVGYVRLTVGPERFKLDYIRTAHDPGENVDTPIGEAAYSKVFT